MYGQFYGHAQTCADVVVNVCMAAIMESCAGAWVPTCAHTYVIVMCTGMHIDMRADVCDKYGKDSIGKIYEMCACVRARARVTTSLGP